MGNKRLSNTCSTSKRDELRCSGRRFLFHIAICMINKINTASQYIYNICGICPNCLKVCKISNLVQFLSLIYIFFICQGTVLIFYNFSILSVLGQGYFRNVLCTLNLISIFLLYIYTIHNKLSYINCVHREICGLYSKHIKWDA